MRNHFRKAENHGKKSGCEMNKKTEEQLLELTEEELLDELCGIIKESVDWYVDFAKKNEKALWAIVLTQTKQRRKRAVSLVVIGEAFFFLSLLYGKKELAERASLSRSSLNQWLRMKGDGSAIEEFLGRKKNGK